MIKVTTIFYIIWFSLLFLLSFFTGFIMGTTNIEVENPNNYTESIIESYIMGKYSSCSYVDVHQIEDTMRSTLELCFNVNEDLQNE